MRALNCVATSVVAVLLASVAVTSIGCIDQVEDADDAFASVATPLTSAGFTGLRNVPLRERVRGVEIVVDRQLTLQPRDGVWKWVLRGTCSYPLQQVFSFVADDAFGSAQLTSPTTFEVVFDDRGAIVSLVAGLRLYLDFELANPTASLPRRLNASLTFAPGIDVTAGHSKLRVGGASKPIALGYDLALRARATVTAGNPGEFFVPQADLNGDGNPDVTLRERPGDQSAVSVDLSAESWRLATVAGGAPIQLGYRRTTGANWFIYFRPTAMVASFAVAVTDDPYAQWPSDWTCQAEVQACLDALGEGTIDTEACGLYYPVRRCNVRAFPATLQTAPEPLATVDEILASAPQATRLTRAAYSLSMSPERADTLRQVVRAVLAAAPLPGLEPRDGSNGNGALSAANAKRWLSSRGLREVLPRLNALFGSDQWQAAELQGRRGKVLVLYYAQVARVAVIAKAAT